MMSGDRVTVEMTMTRETTNDVLIELFQKLDKSQDVVRFWDTRQMQENPDDPRMVVVRMNDGCPSWAGTFTSSQFALAVAERAVENGWVVRSESGIMVNAERFTMEILVDIASKLAWGTI